MNEKWNENEWKISHRSLTLLLHYLVKLTPVWLLAAPAHRARETGGFASRTTILHFSRFVASKQSRSQLQLITRSGLSCSVVYTRGKSTPSTNWSRGWLKFGAALNCRLSTCLLISGAKDLELVFVRRADTLNLLIVLILSTFCHPCHVLLEFCIAE